MKDNKKSMIFMPKCVENFRRIDLECEDSCCSGWSIPIDENTYNKYVSTTDKAFKGLLDKKIIKKINKILYSLYRK